MAVSLTRAGRATDRVLTVLAGAGAVCLLLALAGPLLGVHVLFFRSGSMAPAIPTGSLALTRTVPVGEVRPGDVVSVPTPQGARVTHRVVVADASGLVLRGDANDHPDAMTYRVDRADRVVVHVPAAGYVLGWLAGPGGLLLLGALGLGLLMTLARPGALVAGGAVVLVSLLVAGPGQARPGWAAPWTDPVPVSGASYAAATVGTPTLTCSTAIGSVRFDWSAVAGATGYRLHYGPGGATTEVVSAGVTSRTVLLVGSGTFWVEALRDFGTVTWESASSDRKDYTIIALVLAGCTDA